MSKRKPTGRADHDTDPTSALVDSLLDRLPVELEELPPSIREIVGQAVGLARDGDLQLLTTLLRGMDEAEASIDDDVDESEWLSFALCDEAAADLFRELEDDDSHEQVIAAAVKAIELDRFAVDAMVVLGDLAKSAGECVTWYKRASEAASHRDRQTVKMFMPSIRQHMARHLIELARISDAVEVLLPALEENPDDSDGARYELVDAYLRLGWHDEIDKIADRFRSDELGVIDFARAIISFARSGASRRANALLAAAQDQHPEVAPYLAGAKRMPRAGTPLPPVDYQAVRAAEYLISGLRDVAGVTAWIRDSLSVSSVETIDPFDETGEFDETGQEVRFAASSMDEYTDYELRGLGRRDPLGVAIELPRSDAVWQLHVDKDAKTGGYVAVVLEGAELIAADCFDRRPATNQLREFVRSAVIEPIEGRPRKPTLLRVPTKANVKALEKSCGSYGVAISQGKLGGDELRQIKPAVRKLADHLRRTPGNIDADGGEVELADLPLCDQTWLYGVFLPPMYIHDGPSPRRACVQLVCDTEEGFLLHQEVGGSEPSREAMARSLAAAMMCPLMGNPRRPKQVMLDPTMLAGLGCIGEDSDPFLRQLEDILPGTTCQFGTEQVKTYFDEVVGDLLASQGPTEKSMLQIDGVSEQLLADFYRVVANFYRAKPWKMVGGDQLFDVTCQCWPRPNRTACVIGQLGQEFGIAIYDDPAAARRMIADDGTSMGDVIVVHYGEEFDTIPVDSWFRERNGWTVAGVEAHPFVARVEQGGRSIRCVGAEDIELLMQLLPVVPRFLDHPREEPLRAVLPTGELRLEWCSGET